MSVAVTAQVIQHVRTLLLEWLTSCTPVFVLNSYETTHTPTGRTHSIDTQQGFEAAVMAKTKPP